MSWRDFVTRWLPNKTQESLTTLVQHLVRANMIPTTLIDNYMLHAILLTQIVLETLNDLTVPPAPQGPNFTYRMNAKEVMTHDLNSKNAKQIEQLEEQTGVGLEHYHKLKIENKWT